MTPSPPTDPVTPPGTRPTPARYASLAAAAAAVLAWVTSDAPAVGPPPPEPVLVVDVNRAPEAVLSALPRMGPSIVGRVVAEREAGPFRDVDDLDRRVRGMGPATVAVLRPHLAFPGTTAPERRDGP